MDRRPVLHCMSYGGFTLSKTALLELKRVFPEHVVDIETFPRDNQKIIDYMLKNGGLEKYDTEFCKLGITYVHKDAAFRIHEYDGKERVIPAIPYEKVIDELVRVVNGEKDVEFSTFTKLYLNNDKPAIKKLLS